MGTMSKKSECTETGEQDVNPRNKKNHSSVSTGTMKGKNSGTGIEGRDPNPSQ